MVCRSIGALALFCCSLKLCLVCRGALVCVHLSAMTEKGAKISWVYMEGDRCGVVAWEATGSGSKDLFGSMIEFNLGCLVPLVSWLVGGVLVG